MIKKSGYRHITEIQRGEVIGQWREKCQTVRAQSALGGLITEEFRSIETDIFQEYVVL